MFANDEISSRRSSGAFLELPTWDEPRERSESIIVAIDDHDDAAEYLLRKPPPPVKQVFYLFMEREARCEKQYQDENCPRNRKFRCLWVFSF